MAFWFPLAFRDWIAVVAIQSLDFFGYFYLVLGFVIVLILLVLAFSPVGNKRLGEGPPEYGWYSWITMLYSTGMGAGLMLRAVQEPVYYYTQPPRLSDLEPSTFALEYTFFHWGLTPWAFYGMFGLIIGFFVHDQQRKILSSSILTGRFQRQSLAVPMDVITIVSTLFGVVGAVGLGSRQLLSGYFQLFGNLEVNYTNNAYVVLFLGSLATLSAFSGLKRGIRNLSRFNIAVALFLLGFTFLNGNSLEVFSNLFVSLTSYLAGFVPMSLNLGSRAVGQQFLTDWTYFYWAFWLAWAPFTGVFIARISKGRSIREFVLGVLVIPSFGTFLWFSVFGSYAFGIIGDAANYQGQFDSLYGSIFVFFDHLPFGIVLKILGLALVFTFLITSIDSAIYVLGMFSDKGKTDPNKNYLLLWGMLLALFTVATLLIGKEHLLTATSQLLILIAIPFSVVYALMIGMFLFIIFKKRLKDTHGKS
jgi:glycine betaine transporter